MTGIQIEKLRNRLGLTRRDFAEFLGMTYQGIMNIENGIRNPSPLAQKLLMYIDSLPKQKALFLINELSRQTINNK